MSKQNKEPKQDSLKTKIAKSVSKEWKDLPVASKLDAIAHRLERTESEFIKMNAHLADMIRVLNNMPKIMT